MPQSTHSFDFPFSGREKERALLVKPLESALSGNGSITFILGESGTGKTRLAQNILDTAREKGFTCTLAKCPKGGSLLPYSVWTECLRQSADDMSARAFFEACGSTSSQIFRLLPEFAGRELQNNSEDGAVNPKVSSFEVQTVSQLHNFLAVAQFFYRFSLRSPLFLILDDMQWCDKTSVELFRHIQRGDFKGRRIAIVCTCRDSYLEAENPNLFTLISEMPFSDKISNVISLKDSILAKL